MGGTRRRGHGGGGPAKKKRRQEEGEEDLGDGLQGSQPGDLVQRFIRTAEADYDEAKQAYCVDIFSLKMALQQKLLVDIAARKSFLETFEKKIDNDSYIRRTLRPTFSAHSSGRDSIIRMLLSIDAVQPKVISLLLDRIPSLLADVEPDSDDSLEDDVPRQILAQFRWLESVADGAALASKLLECLQVCPLYLQREIITHLPEIVDDASHQIVVEHLLQLLDTEPLLVAPAIDALSNLSLTGDLLSEALVAMRPLLSSANTRDLPVVLRFLLQSADTSSRATEAVKSIRQHLDIGSFIERDDESQQQQEEAQSGEIFVIEALKSGIQFKKVIGAAILSTFNGVTAKEEVVPLDIWLLLILHSVPQYKKHVITVLRRKVIAGVVTAKLLRKSISSHVQALERYFATLLEIGDTFTKSGYHEDSLRKFASALYQLCFFFFADAFHRQETLGALITHVGSLNPPEVDGAIGTLNTLAKRQLQSLKPFVSSINGILDYLHGLNDSQTRLAYTLFSTLSFTDEVSDNDELLIVIRKQLSHASVRYKRIGIIGVGAVLTMLADPGASKEKQQLAVSILNTATNSCLKDMTCRAFFFDEIAQVISGLSSEIVQFIKDGFLAEFDTTYLAVPMDDSDDSVWMGLQEEANSVINIYPMACGDAQQQANLMLLQPLCRLLQACELAQNDSASEIEGLLELPLRMCSMEDYEQFALCEESTKHQICTSLFHAINWIKELINAFAPIASSEAQQELVAKRAAHLIELEKMLDTCIRFHPSFIPATSADPKVVEKIKQGLVNAKKSKAKGKGKGKATSAFKLPPREEEEISMATLTPLQPLFRDLDFSSAKVLSYSKANDDSVFELPASVVWYLLQSLHEKLVAIFSKAKPSRFSTAAAQLPSSIVSMAPLEAIEQLLPILNTTCEHTERIAHTLAGLAPDEFVDLEDANKHYLLPALLLSFRVFRLLLSCEELSEPSNKALRLRLLDAISSKLFSKEKSTTSVKVAQRKAFSYFISFARTIPTTIADLGASCAVVRLLAAIAGKSVGLLAELSEVAGEMLKVEWPKSKVEQLKILLQAYLKHSATPVAVLATMSTVVAKAGVDPSAQSEFATLDKATFQTFFKSTIEELVAYFDKVSVSDISALQVKPTLKEIDSCTSCLRALLQSVKSTSVPLGTPTLVSILKSGRLFIQKFLKLLPFLKEHFVGNNCTAILSKLQASTRVLQILCAHAKVEKDATLSRLTPYVKKDLERLLFKVKQTISEMGLGAAFTIGQLKHRNIHGEEISSQMPVSDDDESDDDAMEEAASGDEGDEALSEILEEDDGGSCEDDDEELYG